METDIKTSITLSCPGTGTAVVKIGYSNLRPGSKELIFRGDLDDIAKIMSQEKFIYNNNTRLRIGHKVILLGGE